METESRNKNPLNIYNEVIVESAENYSDAYITEENSGKPQQIGSVSGKKGKHQKSNIEPILCGNDP